MIVRVQADTKNYDANLAKASKTLKQFADNNLSMGGILKQSTGALTGMAASVLSVTAAIGAAKKVVGDMVRINMQFEQSSSNLAAVLGTSRDQITALTDQAKALGATTQYTASQILELQANLARLGFNQTEILNSTKSVQAMATAMGADLGEAANLAGSALRGFGLNATEMERVASVLSVGTTKSALSFEKLATALPVVQTAASKTGFTIEDTVAMLGKLTDNGINAASAATQLRKILNDSTTAGTKLANALGGPVKSFDELVVALDKAGKAGQNHADSVALVNSKNATALDILRDMAQQREVDVNGVKKQTSALQELRDSITDCSDGMKSMQDEQLNTLQGSVTILNSAWEGLMLTFSESNGVIKTVVDSLTDLLGAYTKWRQRNQGGDAAIKSYELGMSDEQKTNATSQIERQRASGITDDQIAKASQSRKEGYEKEAAAMEELLKKWEKAGKQGWGSKGVQDLMADVEAQFGKMEGAPYKWAEQMYKIIAGKRDRIAVEDFIIGSVTPAEPGKQTVATEDGKDEDRTKSRLATLKAQYEEQEKAQIASLDRMSMNEADYEAQVYKIKRETLQKIADLYQEETAEKARANAAISQLDIAYQGTQMRLANKGKGTKQDNTVVGSLGDWEQQAANVREYMKGATSTEEYKELQTDLDFILSKIKEIQGAAEVAFAPGSLNDLNQQLSEAQSILASLAPNTEEWANALQDVADKQAAVNALQEQMNSKGGSGVDNAKSTADAWQNAVAAVNNVGSALQQIEDPAAKVSGIVMQAVANIALGFAQAAASPATGAAGVFGWIAAATAGVATMVSTIAAIKSATSGSYAEGGIIPGSSYSGDNLTANVNSGELILNRAQQGSIASQLQGAAQQTVMVEGRISGKDILLSANNTNRAAGGSRGYYTKVK